jgi:hypothetical protein
VAAFLIISAMLAASPTFLAPCRSMAESPRILPVKAAAAFSLPVVAVLGCNKAPAKTEFRLPPFTSAWSKKSCPKSAIV